MSDDDREELIELGYDPDDITDRNLSIERDGDTIVVVDDHGDEVDRHDEVEVGR
jgi:hypothetical protein